MNPIYAIKESKYRWLILAGSTLVTACLGAMMMLTYGWAQGIPHIWLLAGLCLSLIFFVKALLQWKESMEAALARAEPSGGLSGSPIRTSAETAHQDVEHEAIERHNRPSAGGA